MFTTCDYSWVAIRPQEAITVVESESSYQPTVVSQRVRGITGHGVPVTSTGDSIQTHRVQVSRVAGDCDSSESSKSASRPRVQSPLISDPRIGPQQPMRSPPPTSGPRIVPVGPTAVPPFGTPVYQPNVSQIIVQPLPHGYPPPGPNWGGVQPPRPMPVGPRPVPKPKPKPKQPKPGGQISIPPSPQQFSPRHTQPSYSPEMVGQPAPKQPLESGAQAMTPRQNIPQLDSPPHSNPMPQISFDGTFYDDFTTVYDEETVIESDAPTVTVVTPNPMPQENFSSVYHNDFETVPTTEVYECDIWCNRGTYGLWNKIIMIENC